MSLYFPWGWRRPDRKGQHFQCPFWKSVKNREWKRERGWNRTFSHLLAEGYVCAMVTTRASSCSALIGNRWQRASTEHAEIIECRAHGMDPRPFCLSAEGTPTGRPGLPGGHTGGWGRQETCLCNQERQRLPSMGWNTCASWHLASLDGWTKGARCVVVTINHPPPAQQCQPQGHLPLTHGGGAHSLPPDKTMSFCPHPHWSWFSLERQVSPARWQWLFWLASLPPILLPPIHKPAYVAGLNPARAPQEPQKGEQLLLLICVIICFMPLWLPVYSWILGI